MLLDFDLTSDGRDTTIIKFTHESLTNARQMNIWCDPWTPRHVHQPLAYHFVISSAVSHQKPYALAHIDNHISSQNWFQTDRIGTHQTSTMPSSPWKWRHTTEYSHYSYLRVAPTWNFWEYCIHIYPDPYLLY